MFEKQKKKMTYDTFYKLVNYFECKDRQGDIVIEKI
jgi:hypothetical protein